MVSCGLCSVCAAGGVARRQQPGTAHHQHIRAWEQRVNTSRTQSLQYLQKQGSKTESRIAVGPIVHTNSHCRQGHTHLFSIALSHSQTHTQRGWDSQVTHPKFTTNTSQTLQLYSNNPFQARYTCTTETTAFFLLSGKLTSKFGNKTQATA